MIKKNLNVFSKTKKALRLNLDILHRDFKVYKISSNHDRRLTYDLVTGKPYICMRKMFRNHLH